MEIQIKCYLSKYFILDVSYLEFVTKKVEKVIPDTNIYLVTLYPYG
ncbi:MAG: hypothetical protein Dasosvirus13_6 [Dasosvirus sp.]|uniref:Uncharacterized protein n=1 Tax=Dasosvirus sp. TaxID=2487764 RepID=A0A3G4ZRV2_9VIRU|nr:MAG: hypothetical protein Dasosvirus13_6 [Dasosvirus sp.]